MNSPKYYIELTKEQYDWLKSICNVTDRLDINFGDINFCIYGYSIKTNEINESTPKVCKCNIWAGCTCGVMAQERLK